MQKIKPHYTVAWQNTRLEFTKRLNEDAKVFLSHKPDCKVFAGCDSPNKAQNTRWNERS